MGVPDDRSRAESWAGTVSTAGGVVFFGDDDGQLVAVDARTGKHLWHFQMGEGLTASPITYAVDGKQYVAIASATRDLLVRVVRTYPGYASSRK